MHVVIPLPDHPGPSPQLGGQALWMLGVSVMLGVVVVASLATAVIAVRVAS